MGSPARKIRELSEEEIRSVRQNAANYVQYQRAYRREDTYKENPFYKRQKYASAEPIHSFRIADHYGRNLHTYPFLQAGVQLLRFLLFNQPAIYRSLCFIPRKRDNILPKHALCCYTGWDSLPGRRNPLSFKRKAAGSHFRSCTPHLCNRTERGDHRGQSR